MDTDDEARNLFIDFRIAYFDKDGKQCDDGGLIVANEVTCRSLVDTIGDILNEVMGKALCCVYAMSVGTGKIICAAEYNGHTLDRSQTTEYYVLDGIPYSVSEAEFDKWVKEHKENPGATE